MKFNPINYKNDAWNIVITWSRPKRITDYLRKPEDREASLYSVIHRNNKKILYIGMTHRQYSIDRIKDHKYKYGYISTGILKIKWGKYTEQRVKDAESLLIYAYQPLDNTMKRKWITLESTMIENRGFNILLPRYLYYGACKSPL